MLRASQRYTSQLRSLRTPLQRRFASSESSAFHGAEDNAFNRERQAVKEHAAATSEHLERKLTVDNSMTIPALIVASVNAYNLWNEHWSHWEHLPPLEERTEYSYQNIRTKNFFWGEGDKTLFIDSFESSIEKIIGVLLASRQSDMGTLVFSSSRDHPSSRSSRSKLPLFLFSILAAVIYLQFYALPQYIYRTEPTANALKLSQHHVDRVKEGLRRCTFFNTPPVQYPFPVSTSRENPRWNPISGQKSTVILRNSRLFDGENFVDGLVDIVLKKGVVASVESTSSSVLSLDISDAAILDLNGSYVTPGLVDLHSHHMAMSWPLIDATDDTNEVNSLTGAVTPFLRIQDSLKPYDPATAVIASGGVTTSLVIPGSANIIGGEGVVVKNVLRSGLNGEEVVEEILLEHGVPVGERRRYLKMACGENPRRVYKHTRMGNAWHLRKHMARAQDILEKQDQWCLSAAVAMESGNEIEIAAMAEVLDKYGGMAEAIEYDSTIAMLKGKIGINVHCYEVEDFEDMLHHSKEFGFRIQAFHHALEAWKVPEMIKESGENITIATFAEFSLYKKEAYGANLWAGKILAEHGVPVAYKSDHVNGETSAKYLLYQAATAHSFHLSENLALQSVTSVPAKSLELDHRIGFVRQGYDADIVVWDSHPLSVGATPLQVYIDGKATLDPKKVAESRSKVDSKYVNSVSEKPLMRKILQQDVKIEMCAKLQRTGQKIVINGIQKSFLDSHSGVAAEGGNMTMVIDGGEIICLGSKIECISVAANGYELQLSNGYILPGLTLVSVNLGLTEIVDDENTGDGFVSLKSDPTNPDNVVFAKYGVHLEGQAFKRAKIGGITKAITAPMLHGEDAGGFLSGVSVGIKTDEKHTILDGGIFQDDVALHFVVGQGAKADETIPTVSTATAKIRKILFDNQGKDNIYGRVEGGSLPLVVHVENKYDIMQLIKIKQDYKSLKLVIQGGAGVPEVAEELAAAKIPVILTSARDAPYSWEKKDLLVGPPLTKSPAEVLADAGVLFGIAYASFNDAHIHNLAIEAAWAAKFAGLSESAAVNLVSKNIEEILDLKIDSKKRDFVVFEGNPLQFGASVVISVDGDSKIVTDCWPEAQ
ncbi:hypothetical protein B7463_g1891, partial [Scytalidium lignicola]